MAQTDEIDLLELAFKLNKVFIKNIKSLIIAFVIGTAAGLAFYQFVPKVYESKMTITSDILTESYSKSIFDNLEKLIKEKNTKLLSSCLNISEDKASKIGEIKLKGTIEKADNLKEQDKISLNITVETSDNSLWPDLQKGIIDFIEKNDFVKTRVEQRKKYYSSLITKIDRELSDLEILKSKIMEGRISNGSKDGMLLLDPTAVNSKIIDLSKEQLSFKNALELVNSAQLVEGFTIFDKPSSPKLSISLASGASLGLFFVIAIIAIKGFRQMVRLANSTEAK